jgi:hypothetical protein
MLLFVINSYAMDREESWALDKGVTRELLAKFVGIASTLKGGGIRFGV